MMFIERRPLIGDLIFYCDFLQAGMLDFKIIQKST